MRGANEVLACPQGTAELLSEISATGYLPPFLHDQQTSMHRFRWRQRPTGHSALIPNSRSRAAVGHTQTTRTKLCCEPPEHIPKLMTSDHKFKSHLVSSRPKSASLDTAAADIEKILVWANSNSNATTAAQSATDLLSPHMQIAVSDVQHGMTR